MLADAAVAEAAVVGQRDPDGLTRIVAFVVLQQGRELHHNCHPARPEPRSFGAERVEGSAFPAASPIQSLSPAAPAAGTTFADELRAFVRQRLPGYKVPQRIEFVTELPKTATGKIQRFKLRR
ncbi:MAG: hypothetical protein HYY26_02925 [Acidobacteria bacterium]|nr:hypothetical protein [Acidobacteriota bacterium]